MAKIANKSPECATCHQLMAWYSVELVDQRPISVFYCDGCDQYAARAERTKPVLIEIREAKRA